MTVGILCEGGETDAPVLELILSHLFPDTTFVICGVSKRAIFDAGDQLLGDLFGKAVDRVIILWDLLPLGNQMGVASQWSEQPRRREQRQMLLQLLSRSEKLDSLLQQQARFYEHKYEFSEESVAHPNNECNLFELVCVCYSLDGWLLSDHSLLCELASTDEHTMRRLDPDPGKPDQCLNPALALKRVLGKAPNKRWRYYNKHIHNRQIAEAYIRKGRVDRLRRSDSFRRVEEAIRRWGCA